MILTIFLAGWLGFYSGVIACAHRELKNESPRHLFLHMMACALWPLVILSMIYWGIKGAIKEYSKLPDIKNDTTP